MLIGQASRCTLDAIMANKQLMSDIFMSALFRMRVFGSVPRRDGPHSQYCSLHVMFVVTGTFLAYDWFLSNTAINQLLHALNGNGGSRSKGAGKGKGKVVDAPSPVDAERDFLDAVKASMPEAVKLRAQGTPISEEWNVGPYQYMTSKGGFA